MKKFHRFICIILCMTLCIGIFPTHIFAKVDHPVAPHDGLILEFENISSMTEFQLVHGGESLGGNMLLVDGSYQDALYYDAIEEIVSVTYNYTVETAALSDIYGNSRNPSSDDPYLKSDDLAFWQALAVLADSLGENVLHTVRVAVMDTGIDGTHEDLVGRVVAGYDAVEDADIASGINSEQSADSHGTMVAGLIAAQALNGKGIAGKAGAFPVELVPVRVLNENGKGKIADIVRGIYWAIEHDIDILNMSFGARLEYYPTALAHAIRDARTQNILPIAAAGNEYGMTWEGYYPACLEGCYPVMSGTVGMGRDYTSVFSNTFPQGSVPGKDYTAINGADVKTTAMGDIYVDFTGTSASCAQISGYAAAMFSLLGGRTNAYAIDAVIDTFTYAHTTNTNLIRYSIVPAELDDAVNTHITAETVEKAKILIQGAIECEDTLSAEAEIRTKILFGEALVGDVTLVLYDAEGNAVYTSEPNVNNGENKSVYTFTADMTLLSDGEARIGIYYRTADEISTGTAPQTARHFTEKTIRVDNNLIAESATVILKDGDGSVFSAPVYVTRGNELIAVLENNNGEVLTLNRSLFAGGNLTFTCMTSGILYQKTSAFTSEIVLGGEEVQLTVLSFADDTVILAGATVYAKTPNGKYVSIGNTDENGELTVALSDMTLPLIVIDNTRRYILCVTVAQDGNQTKISFAEDVSSAREVTVSAVQNLSDEDRYSLIVSADAFTNAVNGVSTKLFTKAENTIFVSDTSLYTMVSVYDVMYLSSLPNKTEYYKYYYTAHVLGQTDFSAVTEINFDPAVIRTEISLGNESLIYGKSTGYAVKAFDNAGNAMIGGHYLDYASLGSLVDCTTWYGSLDLWLTDGDGNDHSWLIDRSQNQIQTTTDYGMALPAESGVYTFRAKCYIDTYYIAEYEGYTSILPYAGEEVSKEFSVEMGANLRVSLEFPKGASVNLDLQSIRVVNGDQITTAKMLSQNEPYLIDALDFDENTKIFFWMTAYYNEPTALGVTAYCYPVMIAYDAENPDVTLKIPDTDFGVLDVKVGENTVYNMTMTVEIGNAKFNVPCYSEMAYPVGEYGISFITNDMNGAYVVAHETVKTEADTQTLVVVDTENYISVTVNKTNMTNTVIYPVIKGNVMQWADPYYGFLYEESSVLLISPNIDGICANFYSQHYQHIGGYSYLAEIPLTVGSVVLDAMNTQIISFEAMPQKAEFSEDEDVILNLEAYITGTFRLRELKQAIMSGGGKEPSAISLYPVLQYRIVGGEWNLCELPDWTGISLGKLAPGTYEAIISFEDINMENGAWESSFAFVVAEREDTQKNTVLLSAPSASKEEVILTVTGIPGASVTLSYTTPVGAEKTMEAFVIPASGTYRLHLSLSEEGKYVFYAVSVLNGENDAEAIPITIENTYAVPAEIHGFTVRSLENGSLKLTWNEPSDAKKVYVYRDGTPLGYLPADVTEYTDSYAHLNASRTYTYTLIAENEAGTKGKSVYAQGKPSLISDTEKPTAPVTLSAEAEGMKIKLTWTKSTDNVGIIGYRIYRDGVLIKDTVKRSFTDEGLERAKEYSYCVTAYDSAGNESEPSVIVRAKTAEQYTIDTFTVKLDTNRLGNITDDRMSVIVNVSDVDVVLVKIDYITDSGSDGVYELNLGRSGGFWMGTWAFTDIREIVSVTAYAYKDDEQVAQKEADGFPRSVSSRINLSLSVTNAAYAQNALANISLVLKDTERNLIFRQGLYQNGENAEYSFDRLSKGNYQLTVEYTSEGKTYVLYSKDNIVLNIGEHLDIGAIQLENFIRIKEDYPFMIYGVSIYDSLTDDGYLMHGGDSALFVPSGEDSLTLITPWNLTDLYLDGAFYSIDKTYRIDLSSGVSEYTVDTLAGIEPMAAEHYRFRFNAGEDISLKGLAVRFSWGSTPVLCYLDENGECELAVPEGVFSVDIDVEETLLKEGTTVLEHHLSVWLNETNLLHECFLKTVSHETVKIQFTSDADTDGVKIRLIGAKEIVKLVLDESGYAELSLDMAKNVQLLASIERAFVGDYHIPAQIVKLTYNEETGIYHAVIRSEKANLHTVNLKFEDAEGFSVKDTTVEISSRFETKVFRLGEDGMLSATLYCAFGEDPITVSFSGKKDQLEWSTQRFAVLPGEDICILTVHSKRFVPISGDSHAYRYELFYGEGEDMRIKQLSAEGNMLRVDTSFWGNNSKKATLIAIPGYSAWKVDYLSEYSAEERLTFWQNCNSVKCFLLNEENFDQPISLGTPEFYTVTSIKEMTGEPLVRAAGYLYVGDTLLYGFDIIPGTKIPVFTSDQHLIVTSGMDSFLTEQELLSMKAKYRNTFCLEYDLIPTTANEIDMTFGYQKMYRFELTDTQGNAHSDIMNCFIWFDKDTKRYLGYYHQRQSSVCALQTDASSAYTLFAGWIADCDSTMLKMYSFWDAMGENVARYDLDPTVEATDTIAMTAKYEPIYRLSRINGCLSTDVKSITPKKDGSYLVRLIQNGAFVYDSVIELPEGAFDVQVDGVSQGNLTEISMPMDVETYHISFNISKEDFENDPLVECYIVTPYGKNLQFVRELSYNVFSYGLHSSLSSNEVRFVPISKTQRTMNETFDSYKISVFDLSTTYGASYGYDRVFDGYHGVDQTARYLYTDVLNPDSEDYNANYSREDYKGYAYSDDRGIYRVYEGKWITFTAETDDFAIALNVDGIPLILNADPPYPMVSVRVGDRAGEFYLLANGMIVDASYRMPTTGIHVDCSFLNGYDEENGIYWLTSEFLADYGFYDPDTGYGMLFIPMAEPEAYPHVYDIDLKFRYYGTDGEQKTLSYDESMAIYFDAPVLQKWNFEHYGSKTVQTSPYYYETITNKEDRDDFRKESNQLSYLDWNGTDIFTFNAWFDYPEEVAHVYAVADVPDFCENKYFELFYDEELGYFTGTGLLGDTLNPPKNYNIVYELAAEQPYGDMPSVQLMDLIKNIVEDEQNGAAEMPEGWTVEEVAPGNGWTLAETYEKWTEVDALLTAISEAGGTLSEQDLIPILGEELRLYLPTYNLYDDKGELVISLQNYYNLSGVREEADYSFDLALMNKTEHYATLTTGVSIDEERAMIRYITGSDNLSLIMPDFGVETVESAGIAGILGVLKPLASSAGSAISSASKSLINAGAKAIGVGKNLAASGKLTEGADFVSNAFLVRNTFLSAETLDSMKNIARESPSTEWMNYLTPQQHREYMRYQAVANGHNLVSGAFSLFPSATIPGIILTVYTDILYGVTDIESKYKKMAELNKQMLENQERMIKYLRDQNCDDFAYHIDPSGYVFEGMESNLLSGVTATVYYLDGHEWVKWDSEAYGEGPNPNITDTAGQYGWDVLIGKWKVIFEKDGYYSVESIELDVPPAHLDVNMSMVSKNPANLINVKAGAAGAYIDFIFDRPVLVEDVKNKVSVLFCGEIVDGMITAQNEALTVFGNKQAEGSHDVVEGQSVATVFRFVPDEALDIGVSVVLTGEQGILTYNGLECDAFESEYIEIPETVVDPITALYYEGIEILEIGDTLDLREKLMITGNEGELVFKALNPDVVNVSDDGIVEARASGMAYVMISCGDVKTVAAISVDAEPHFHTFDVQMPLIKCLASEANCVSGATYYYLCECGEMSQETYEYGEKDADAHLGNIEWVKTEIHHSQVYDCCGHIVISESEHDWENGVCSECSYGCEHTGGIATCVALAVCEHCGQHYGEKNRENHVGNVEWKKTATHHSRVYDCCGHVVISESEHDWENGVCSECSYGCEHTGGIATCVALAVCEHCGQHYGEKNRENHVGEVEWKKTATHHSQVYDCCGHVVISESEHDWENGVCSECSYGCEHTGGTATCVALAVCEHCGQHYGEKNRENHVGEVEWKKTATHHSRVYDCCGYVVISESEHDWENGVCSECSYGCEHTGGTATCVALAVCEHCGQHYGEKNRENHVGEVEWKKTATHHSRVYDCCGYVVISESEHHWENGVCSECSYGCEHTGGIATCVAFAVCEHCGQHYGEKNRENHVGNVEWKKTATHHSRVYDCCGYVVISESEHHWEKGICTECSYGCEHFNSLGKHVCDYCKKVFSECKDTDKDHKCDICEKKISDCIDENSDMICDICGKNTHIHRYHILKSDTAYHWYVCDCGQIDPDSRTIHDLDHGIITKQATHTKTGLILHYCKVCNELIKTVIPQTQVHSFGKWISYDQNVHIGTCDCGAVRRENHDFSAWEMIQLPTVSEEGIEISLCKDCGYQRTRSVERLPEETTTETVTETTTSESTTETVTEISSATETTQTTVESMETATSVESFTETTTDISVNDHTEMMVWIVCIVLISIGGVAVVICLYKKKFHQS